MLHFSPNLLPTTHLTPLRIIQRAADLCLCLFAYAIASHGSFSHHWSVWERVIAMMAGGQLDVGHLVSARLPLQAWQDGFEGMHRGEFVKVVLTPDGAGA